MLFTVTDRDFIHVGSEFSELQLGRDVLSHLLNNFSSAPQGLQGGATIFKEITNKGQWQGVYRQ